MATVIFDLDGTLVDSALDLQTATSSLLQRHGRRSITLDETRSFVGRGARVLIARAFAATGSAAGDLDALHHEYLELYLPIVAVRTVPYPGAVEVLEHLQSEGAALALCTNKPEAHTHALLDALELRRFFGDAVVGASDRLPKKPAPDMVLEALRLVGRPPEGSVMVGDSPADVGAAHAAGISVVAVPWGYREVAAEAMGADRLIASFEELPAAVADLTA